LGRKHGIEPQEAAQPGGMARHFRAVEPGHHRRWRGAALAGDRFVVGLFLVRAHFARRKQLQAHVRFLLFRNRCGCAEYTGLGTVATSAAAWVAARGILNSAIRPLRSIRSLAMETPPCPISSSFKVRPAPG